MLTEEYQLLLDNRLAPQCRLLYVALRQRLNPNTNQVTVGIPQLKDDISYRPSAKSRAVAQIPTDKQVRDWLKALEQREIIIKTQAGDFKKRILPSWTLPLASHVQGHAQGRLDPQENQGLQPFGGHVQGHAQGQVESFSIGDDDFASHVQSLIDKGLAPLGGHLEHHDQTPPDPSKFAGHLDPQENQGLQPFGGHKYNNNNNNNIKVPIESESKPAKKSKTKTKYKYSADDFKTAEYFKSILLQSYLAETGKPYTKKINLESWANTIRLINQVEKRSHREICELFRYARLSASDWYRANILSPSSLRKWWEKLTLEQAKQTKHNQKKGSHHEGLSNVSKQLSDPRSAIANW
ncbi:hypothetical protein tloyanaT_13400 [Thalassotalea loyana]|uniref:Uncharacterized protein n=1 Tax=Thalassotalea loyana TaxID=280483 RepID=A0ABQ6HAD9_9GAMM|nr:hypothetical protein [Thalassotalea loyana]GLX85088.1 hypothetical protein tloyanaT_13400 [Thalassotalea loyana]